MATVGYGYLTTGFMSLSGQAGGTTNSAQDWPEIVALGGGRFFAAWISGTGAPIQTGIFDAQMHLTSGSILGLSTSGVTLTINDPAGSGPLTAVHLANGDVALAWSGSFNPPAGGTTDGYGLAVIDDVTGAITTPSQIIAYTGVAVGTVAALTSDGSDVVLGYGGMTGSLKSYIKLLEVNAAGALDPSFGTAGLVTVNSTTDGWPADVAMATLTDGNIVDVWRDSNTSAMSFAIFTPAGQLVTQAANFDTGGNGKPAVVALANGGFVVAYYDWAWSGGAGTDITLAAFKSDGTSALFPNWLNGGSVLRLTSNGFAGDPGIVAHENGWFTVVWTEGAKAVEATTLDSNGALISAATTKSVLFGLPINPYEQLAKLIDTVDDVSIANAGGGSIDLAYQHRGPYDAVSGTPPPPADISGARVDLVRTTTGDDTSETLTGYALADSILGGGGDDSISGGAGNDTLIGGVGNDTLIGGAGADSLQGGDGIDFASYAAAATGVAARFDYAFLNIGEAAGDTYASVEGLTGSGFADVLVGDGNGNSLYAGGGDDYLAGLAGNDQLSGEAGNDILDAGAGNDTLDGGTGNDTLDGGAGADSLIGGGGFDMVSYGSAATGIIARLDIPAANTGDAAGDIYTAIAGFFGSGFGDVLVGDGNANSVYGGGGADYLAGLAGNDQLFGEAGNDILDAGAGNDTLNGGAGNDTLDGGAGADSMIGGGGFDLVSYGSAAAGLTARLDIPAANTGDAAGDTYSGIAGFFGSGFGDVLVGDGNANSLYGGGGGDYLAGLAGNDQLFGEAGNDILDGGAGNDTLDGGSGDDILDGGAGADSFVGGGGVDMVTYGSAPTGLTARLDIPAANTGDAAGDTYTGITGFFGSGLNDVLVGDGSANTVYGGGGGDYLAGLAGTDQLFGEAGNDILDGGAGNDTLNGGGGDDILDGGAGADSLIGGGGVDMVTYGTAATGITAWLQFPSVNTGDAAGDTYTGISGLIGSAFADFLLGDANANILNGGGGNDLLYGGVGSDTFVFNSAGFGIDTVQDFATTAAAGVNHDFLDFRGSGIANLGAVTMNQLGADTYLVTSQGTVILQNISAGTLVAGDFLF